MRRDDNIKRWWHWEDILLIIFLGCVLYLPGLYSISLFDRDEPRFAEAAREMCNSGNYIVPRFDGQLRPDKPPMIYWLMCGAYRMFGVSGGSARLPSAVFAIGTLLLVYWLAGVRFGRVTGVVAAIMLAVSALFVVESRLATADSVLIFWTTLAMGLLWCAWESLPADADGDAVHARISRLPVSPEAGTHDALNETALPEEKSFGWPGALLFWFAIAMGVLTKGVTPLFVLASVVALSVAAGWRQRCRSYWQAQKPLGRMLRLPIVLYWGLVDARWRWLGRLKPIIGFPLLLVLLVPWFAAAWQQTHGKLIQMMLQQNVVERTTSGLQHHGFPPGFYLAVVWATFWPWSVLLVPAAYHVVRRAWGRTPIVFDERPYRFLLAWIVPSWILFELFVTKMVQYVLPLYIPLAIMCADVVVQSWHRLTDVLAAKWFGFARWVWCAIWLILAGVLVAFLWGGAGTGHHGLFVRAAVVAGSLVGVGVAGGISWNRPSWPYVTAITFTATLVLTSAMLLPSIPGLQLSRQAGQRMLDFSQRGYKLAAAGYQEPTLVFYTGGGLPLYSSAAGLLGHVSFAHAGASLPPASVKYCVAVDRRVLAALKRRHIAYYVQDWFSGIKVAKGRPVRVTLITNVPVLPHTGDATTTATGAGG